MKNEFHIIHIMEGIYMKEQYKIIVLSDELSRGKIQNALDKNKCKTIVHVVDVSAIVQIENSFQYIIIYLAVFCTCYKGVSCFMRCM